MVRPHVFNVFIEIRKRKFICILVLAIILRVLLDSVVGEMDHPILQVFCCEFLRSSSNVPFLVPVAPQIAVEGSHQHIASNIKFSLVI